MFHSPANVGAWIFSFSSPESSATFRRTCGHSLFDTPTYQTMVIHDWLTLTNLQLAACRLYYDLHPPKFIYMDPGPNGSALLS